MTNPQETRIGEALLTITKRLGYLDMSERKEADESFASYSHRTSTEGRTVFVDTIRLVSGLLKITTSPIGDFPPSSEDITVDLDDERVLAGTLAFSTDPRMEETHFEHLEMTALKEGLWVEELFTAAKALDDKAGQAALEEEAAHEKAVEERIQRKLGKRP